MWDSAHPVCSSPVRLYQFAPARKRVGTASGSRPSLRAELDARPLGDQLASQFELAVPQQRRRLDAQLKPYRSKMTAAQLSMLERQYLDRELLERSRLPRLSLFYMK